MYLGDTMTDTRTGTNGSSTSGSSIAKTIGAVLACLLLLNSAGCAPTVSRGGDGTANTRLDDAALSTGLDKADLDYLVDENLQAFYDSRFWKTTILDERGDPPLFTIFPIRNDTTEHLGDQMETLLSGVETSLVNSGAVGVVSRERQTEMMREVVYQQSGDIDPASAASIGRQLGAKYYVTGKLGAVDERLKKVRRVQYSLFLQVIEVENSLIRFQNETARSKAIKK
jgi:hypothetical protein